MPAPSMSKRHNDDRSRPAVGGIVLQKSFSARKRFFSTPVVMKIVAVFLVLVVAVAGCHAARSPFELVSKAVARTPLFPKSEGAQVRPFSACPATTTAMISAAVGTFCASYHNAPQGTANISAGASADTINLGTAAYSLFSDVTSSGNIVLARNTANLDQAVGLMYSGTSCSELIAAFFLDADALYMDFFWIGACSATTSPATLAAITPGTYCTNKKATTIQASSATVLISGGASCTVTLDGTPTSCLSVTVNSQTGFGAMGTGIASNCGSYSGDRLALQVSYADSRCVNVTEVDLNYLDDKGNTLASLTAGVCSAAPKFRV